MSSKRTRILLLCTAILLLGVFLCISVSASSGETPDASEPADGSVLLTTTGSGMTVDDAYAYLDDYNANINDDPAFDANLETALATVRQDDVTVYATVFSLLPAVLAIVLALITKEVYSSLFIGILAGALLYAGFNPVRAFDMLINGGLISAIADAGHAGILIFLVVLGIIVVLMNKAGGSAAYGKWAAEHIKSRTGAMISTFVLGVLIFVDDYFNCLTVGSVMRPVTDKHGISRAKLAYIIDATAAPICMIAPVSSWAAAVTGVVKDYDGLKLFINAIPYNLYSLLTVAMILFIAFLKLDYGPMRVHEENAKNGDLFTTAARPFESAKEETGSSRGKVIDLVLPVVILIICCIAGLIYTGVAYSGATDIVSAFADCDSTVGLAVGSLVALLIIVIYYLCRRVLSFRQSMEGIPAGFKAMVPAILILTFAWALSHMTSALGAKIFVAELVRGSASAMQLLLPAIIFLIAIGLSFSTGTSWGTFGILLPIIVSVGFSGEMLIISVSACLAGAVCGDHCSPISDTTIMASSGAQCEHINHVSTQLPYALTVAAVSFVGYVIAGFVQNAWIVLAASVVILFVTLFIIKTAQKKRA